MSSHPRSAPSPLILLAASFGWGRPPASFR